MFKHGLIILVAGVLLVACSQDPEPAPASTSADDGSERQSSDDVPTPEPTASADERLQSIAEDPAALREAMRDPEQRETLIEAMRERREARRAESEAQGESADRAAMRERMRERRAEMMAERGAGSANPRERMLERNRWWTNDDLRASIGLNEAQAEALTRAQLDVEEQRQAIRQELSEQQRGLMEAVREADRSNILDRIEQRARTQQSLQELELEWWRTMLDELSDDQLAALAKENPRALMWQGRR